MKSFKCEAIATKCLTLSTGWQESLTFSHFGLVIRPNATGQDHYYYSDSGFGNCVEIVETVVRNYEPLRLFTTLVRK
jgi:hypothetical protein